MGRKPFINKKQATTYNLIYRSSEKDEDSGGRQWLEADRRVGIGRPDIQSVQEAAVPTGYPSGHPLAWLSSEQDDISEERRKDIIQLGFPDDGYDYIKHLRTLGQGRAALEAVPADADGASAADLDDFDGTPPLPKCGPVGGMVLPLFLGERFTV